MVNPYLHRSNRSKTDHGGKSEKRLAKSLKARLTPGSGAMDGAKGDMVRKGLDITLRIEAKSTTAESLSLKMAWLEKITREALDTSCQPAVTISFVHGSGQAKRGGDWVLIPKALFDLLEELK